MTPNNNNNNNKNQRPSYKWWNKDCKGVTENRRQAYINYKSNPNNENLKIWIEENKIAKQTIRTIKSNSFKELVGNLNPNTKLKDIWDTVTVNLL